MDQKKNLRKKYLNLRKKKYFEINKKFFLPLINFLKANFKKKKINLAIYYPANFELNVVKILENNYISQNNILLPVIETNRKMEFFLWKKNHALFVNKYGMLEPNKIKNKIPDVILIPLLSFDLKKYRLGYGMGFYDRYLSTYSKRLKNIITIGVAFSFQKHHKLPRDKNDIKLNYILTEKGMF